MPEKALAFIGAGGHASVVAEAAILVGWKIAGHVIVGHNVLIGAGSFIRQRLKIGSGAVVHAGSIAMSDIPFGATWSGNPGHALK